MRAGARIQACIDLLDEIAESRYPADRAMAYYFKQRRYIGSKDKAAVSEYFYAVLRQRGSIEYLLEQAGLEFNSRRAAAVLLHLEGEPIEQFFTGEQHQPKPLSSTDLGAIRQLDVASLQNAADHQRLNFPQWLSEQLRAPLAHDFEAEMAASNQRAHTDIRVNTLSADRQQVAEELSGVGYDFDLSELSPWGIRFKQRVALFNLPSFKKGRFEIQDEGSQLLALATGVQSGDKVVDFCAGAGGKTLAMAAMMQNTGVIHACDVHTRRLEQLGKRTKRAGVHNARVHVLSSEHDKWVKQHKGQFDRVLIDAPCSGTGTWRRSPDSRWNLSPENLDNLVALQQSILESASRLVKPGGTLFYATCSLLNIENDMQIADFLARNEQFAYGQIGNREHFESISNRLELGASSIKTFPAKTGTDGFYVCALQKKQLTEG